MKSPYVKELQPNQTITAPFLVHTKEIRQKKTGEPYLSLMLGDRTGDVEAKMWDNVAEVMETFDRDDFVKVKGLVQVYHNRPQLTIHKLRRVDDSEVDFSDFFPASERDPEEMFAELREVIAGIGNPHLKALLEALFADEEIARRFRTAPAAKQVHHAFLGGLIEHVLSVCRLSRFAASHYKNIDADLLLTGAILHDLGKIYELNYSRSFSYSTEGQLLGHMIIALRMVDEKLRSLPGFPRGLRNLVEHIIISHHGRLEFGSPKVPLFPEALLLHFLDDLDSKMECMRSVLDRDRLIEGDFTMFSAPLERTLLKKWNYLSGEPAVEPPSPVPDMESDAPPEVGRGDGAPAPPQASLPAAGPAKPSPGAERATAARPPAPRSTAFGEKLLEALQPPAEEG